MKKFTPFVVALLLVVNQSQGMTPEWTLKVPAAAKWHTVTSTGFLLVGTEGSLLCIDPDTGALMWKRDDLDHTGPFSVREVAGTPYVLVNRNAGAMATTSKVECFDIIEGKTVWSQDVQGHTAGFFPVPDKNLAVLFLSQQQDAVHGLQVAAFNLDKGEKLWQVPYADNRSVILHVAEDSGRFLQKFDLCGNQEPVLDGDNLLVPFAGVQCIDLKTGAQKWTAAFDPAHKTYKKAYAPLLLKDDTVYAAGRGEVYAVNKADGTVKWKSKKIGSGIISELQVIDDVVYVRVGGNFYDTAAKQWKLDLPLIVMALDKASGNQLWEFRNIHDGITNIKPLPELKTVMLSDARNLIGLDTDSHGKAQEKFRVPLKFTRSIGGGEVAANAVRGLTGGLVGLTKAVVKTTSDKDRLDIPVAIYSGENNHLIVRGKQHLLSFDPATQTILWATQYAAPGAPGWETAIMAGLTALSSAYYSAAPAASGMSTSAAMKGKEQAFAQFDKVASRRYEATKTAGDFTYILTTVAEGKDRGVGLIAVDMKTGDAAKQIILHEKDPDYEVDDVSGRLFFFKGKSNLESYRMR